MGKKGEKELWALWICRRIRGILLESSSSSSNSGKEERCNDYAETVVLCRHVQKVKSFAPRVDHLVADVFVGPETATWLGGVDRKGCRTGVVDKGGKVVGCPDEIDPPSCALGGGVLDQGWMIDGGPVVDA